ncbi:hypothetical protein [Oxobacter pfennigii]|uniref:hypothetical protein n=1 Tax=Oxobacter pfennigii TaxID=36849 RepID=UPI001364E07D|nr:hypothetical protein [Oxobacter pfennigii]
MVTLSAIFKPERSRLLKGLTKLIYPQYDLSHTEEYIIDHLEHAQVIKHIFTDKTVHETNRYSSGAAMAANKLATHALMFASSQESSLRQKL